MVLSVLPAIKTAINHAVTNQDHTPIANRRAKDARPKKRSAIKLKSSANPTAANRAARIKYPDKFCR